jgi:ParB-like chromosome segregation protein Spo0J
MKIEQVKIDKLIPYANNAREHDDKQIAQIAGSIREYGFNNPILIDENNTLIAGHGRLYAAMKLELKDVPCIRLPHLTELQKKAYILADNKIALNSHWNASMLDLELRALQDGNIDLSTLGFNEADLSRLADDKDQERLDAMVADAGIDDDESTQKTNDNEDMFPLSFMLENDHRDTIFKALRKAKEKHSFENSGQALWVICKEYLDA